MFNKIITVIIITFTLVSCQNKTTQKWEETMRVHDEVMLKMEATGTLGLKINNLIEQTQKADSNTILFSKLDTLQSAYSKLELSEEEMMDWMASIQKPKKGDRQDSIIQYLEQEQKAIIEVGHHMDAAIENAELILNSLENIK